MILTGTAGAVHRRGRCRTVVGSNATASATYIFHVPTDQRDLVRLTVFTTVDDPVIAFSGDKVPTPEQIADMHHLAHKECFIANSVLTEIAVAGLPSH